MAANVMGVIGLVSVQKKAALESAALVEWMISRFYVDWEIDQAIEEFSASRLCCRFFAFAGSSSLSCLAGEMGEE